MAVLRSFVNDMKIEFHDSWTHDTSSIAVFNCLVIDNKCFLILKLLESCVYAMRKMFEVLLIYQNNKVI